MSQIRFLVKPGRRLLLFFLTYVVGMILTAFVAQLLMHIGAGGKEVAMLRIATVLQDILVFILPPLITALIITRQPVKLLAVGTAPSGKLVLAAIATLIVASPAMSWLVEWNQSLHLPESMSALESKIRAMEDAAGAAVQTIMGAPTPGNMLVNVLIIGILAGFSEELFFRGGLQRLLSTANMSPAAAIWISALIFSALHMQFFGFFPRLLLGAFFGYLLVWSGSVWLPILIHALNNSLYVILQQTTGSGEPDLTISSTGTLETLVSAVLAAALIYYMYKNRKTT